MLFGEDQARYLVTVPAEAADAFVQRAKAAGVPALQLGTTGGGELTLPGERPIVVGDLKTAHESWLPAYMAGPA